MRKTVGQISPTVFFENPCINKINFTPALACNFHAMKRSSPIYFFLYAL